MACLSVAIIIPNDIGAGRSNMEGMRAMSMDLREMIGFARNFLNCFERFLVPYYESTGSAVPVAIIHRDVNKCGSRNASYGKKNSQAHRRNKSSTVVVRRS